MKKTLSH